MKKTFFAILPFVFIFTINTKVQAQEYEEVSYDELVNRLSKKKNSISQSTNSNVLDEIMIHAGFGLSTSSLSYEVSGVPAQKQISGFQLSLGIDLFSPQWVAEGAIRNFGSQETASEVKSFREMDLKIMYKSLVETNSLYFHLGTGITTRYLKISNYGSEVNETTPASVFFIGLDNPLSKFLSVGFDLSYRSGMLNKSIDKSSVDLMLRMDTHF